jgi:hypothetical protein
MHKHIYTLIYVFVHLDVITLYPSQIVKAPHSIFWYHWKAFDKVMCTFVILQFLKQWSKVIEFKVIFIFGNWINFHLASFKNFWN